MASNHSEVVGRPTNKEHLKMWVRDEENSTLITPIHDLMHRNQTLGKVENIKNELMWEENEKYMFDSRAKFISTLQVRAVPFCFDHCIKDVEGTVGLSGAEKNCLRECYFKKITSNEDTVSLIRQLHGQALGRQVRENHV